MKQIIFGQSYFSIGESMLSPEELVEQAAAVGSECVVLSDTMTISGLIRFTNAAKKAGIRPIIGCRLRVVDRLEKEKKPPEFFPSVYPLNDDGMQALFDTLSQAYDEDHFYYVPRISIPELLDLLRTKNFAVSTGSLQSVYHREDASALVSEIADACGANRTFSELVPINTPLFDKLNYRACQAAKDTPVHALVTYPVRYKSGDDAKTLEVLAAITGNSKMADGWRPIQFVKDFVPESIEVVQRCVESKARIEQRYGAGSTDGIFGNGLTKGREALLEAVNYTWQKQEISLPEMADDEVEAFKALIRTGFKERLLNPVMGHQPADLKPYLDRVASEMKTLIDMGFVRYFLVVHELVQWAKQNKIMVGPGRGSVGGSLVAYLLGITDVDPLRFGLYFERFINPERLDLPDADLDFMSARRHEVIDHLKDRYGSDNVAGISNYATLGAASALRDAGRVFGLMPYEYSCSKQVDKETLEEAFTTRPDVTKFAESHPDVWAHALKLQGRMRSMGRHAAGVVVGGVPLRERGVIETRRDEVTINWDKRTVEDMGLVKMDILGLSTLDMLSHAAQEIEKITGAPHDYLSLPLDDPKVLESFGSGDTVGVFQFESPGMRHLLKSLAKHGKVSFDDATAATALYRPGPMESGLMDQFVGIAQGTQIPVYEHPNTRDALEPTNGVLIYQEQVMQIARDLCGFTMADSDHLRKAMGKKDPVAMAKQRDKFVAGAVSVSGMPQRDAEALFDKIDKFAGYAFNKSHSVEYTIISYWSMWVKTYYPAVFFAAQLSTVKEERLEVIVKDAQKHGVSILPPDINLSNAHHFRITGNSLLAPFDRVKGMSERTGELLAEIVRECGQEIGGATNLRTVLGNHELGTKINTTVRSRLKKIGALSHRDTACPATDPSRLKDQKEFLPGLMIEVIKTDRLMAHDKFASAKLMHVLNECRACEKCDLQGTEHPWPKMGKKPKVMVITDCPNRGEASADALMKGQGADYITKAIHAAGMHLADFYFTTLVKAPKNGNLTNDQINACKEYLDREIDILQPPIILAAGSKAIRYLMPSVKGGMDELCGQVHFDKKRDANLVFGLTPGAIYIEPDRQELLNAAFTKVAEMIEELP